jgi:UDP-N-acetylmuramate--alanine ligase
MEHGNFIVNRGQASAAEVQELIARMQKEAKATRGITLETEVQILGEDEVVF